MSKRHAEVDLTRASDTEPEQDVPDTEEGLEWENPNQWMRLVTAIIIGAWIWCGKKIYGRKKDSVHQWGEELFENHQLKFLLRRDAVIPARLPSDLFIHPNEPVPCWKPLEDYTYYFLRCQQWDNVDLELLAVAELRWVASGGILSMDSNENIVAYNNRTLPEIHVEFSVWKTNRKNGILRGPPADRISASRVDSIPPTQESVDLLACLENWNDNQLPEELQFPKALLHILVEYALATWVHLVISSTCPHLDTRCHFGSTRRLRISVDTDIRAVLYSYLYVNEFALMATEPQGQVHDFSVLSRLPARDLCVCGEREIHLQVQAKLEFSHECAVCGDSFRCIPLGFPAPADCECEPPPDNKEGCECHRVNEDIWYCSNACYFYG